MSASNGLSLPCTVITTQQSSGIQNHCSVLVAGVSEDEKAKVLNKCIRCILNFLDLHQILPSLIQKGMLTTEERETLYDMNNRYTRENKINHLIMILPRKGFQWYERFIAALTESSNGTGHMDVVRALNRELAGSDSPPLKRSRSESKWQPSEISGATSEFVESTVAAKASESISQSMSSILQRVHQTEIQLKLLENHVKLLSLTKSLIDRMEQFRLALILLQKIYVTKYRNRDSGNKRDIDTKLEQIFKQLTGCNENFDLVVEMDEWEKGSIEPLQEECVKLQTTLFSLNYDNIAKQQAELKLHGQREEDAKQWIKDRQDVVKYGYDCLNELAKLGDKIDDKDILLDHVEMRHEAGKQCLASWSELIEFKSVL